MFDRWHSFPWPKPVPAEGEPGGGIVEYASPRLRLSKRFFLGWHMSIKVRQVRSEDARAFLEVHHAAVRGIAAKDYPPEVIEDWAPIPVTEKSIERFLTNPDDEVRLVAEIDGKIVGVGALILAKCEFRACYVAPEAARSGVGSALVREIERIA